MTTKEEAIAIVKAHLEKSYSNYFHLVEDLILEDEELFILFYESKDFIKHGVGRVMRLPVLFIDKKTKQFIELESEILNPDYLENRFLNYKRKQGKSIRIEEINQLFTPLYEYNVKRKWTGWRIFYTIRDLILLRNFRINKLYPDNKKLTVVGAMIGSRNMEKKYQDEKVDTKIRC